MAQQDTFPGQATPVHGQATPRVSTVPPRSIGTAYILWAFFGLIGGHQFYLGKVVRALSMLFTLGWLGIGVLVDLFTLEGQVHEVNRRRGVIVQYVNA